MPGSADDGPEWQRHIGNKEKRRKLANRFKDAKDPFKIVIVRDIMWLTGLMGPACTQCMPTSRCSGRLNGPSRIGSSYAPNHSHSYLF